MGVYDKADLFCHVCGKKTLHETGWESESPTVLETECLECHTKKVRDERSFGL